LLYRASKHDCDVCPIRTKCCTTAQARKIPRDLHEDARDIARRQMRTKAFARSKDERKRVEMRFTHLKTPTMASSACGFGVFQARATSSISLKSYRTLKRLLSESSVHHRTNGAYHLLGSLRFVGGPASIEAAVSIHQRPADRSSKLKAQTTIKANFSTASTQSCPQGIAKAQRSWDGGDSRIVSRR
jgi:adenine-specific DNA glycosylase